LREGECPYAACGAGQVLFRLGEACMSLTSVVRRAAQVNAWGPAVIDGPVRMSWSAFADRISRVAGGLVALGLLPGERVAIVAVNHASFL